MNIANNLSRVREKISQACQATGRDLRSVKLLAVTKTVDVPQIQKLVDLGQTLIAESRPQVLRDKARELTGKDVHWHFIGSLQTNKIKYVYPLVEMVQSIDRAELLEAFAEWFQKTGRKCPCLLEVHISDEESKHGFPIESTLEIIKKIKDRNDIDVRGMMGMAPFVDDQEMIRKSFRSLANLFKASKEFQGNGYRAEELSMGMSDDFPIAIEEGSTIVRIGRALFEGAT